ncbi:peptidyl-prolyl cis-trans isomerase FKBP65 [Heracleum sosnowskyi]|uniref:peptidylprolyl isomerase n=1 Tax=Heracleum sosnowskyi TaxID=360622 RepID=A0AAD8HF52_9APIA|nr:peptidyl-prolyl cis-trans isomerase FKBP65 [Heracleum sosnowskyi]
MAMPLGLLSENKSLPQVESRVSNMTHINIGNQGLQKKILRKGNSWKTPSLGDQIQVHYSVCLEDGEQFNSSRSNGKPFAFKLGQCEVIKGWDEGIATMKKGERAILTIPPELAYGEIGCPPLIPPNSTLVFDIELLSWNTIRDITEDGGILKKIVEEGEGWACPKEFDEVVVKYNARLENGTIVSKSEEGIEFCVSNGYLCPAMSKAVKTMRKGEKAELSVKFSYGCRETENLSSQIDSGIHSNLIIDLELISWKSVTDIMGDKKVLKKIVRDGEGFDRPNEGSKAKVIYIGKLEDGTIIEKNGSDEEPFEYTCFEEQINEGLDRAVMTMKKGEQAIVTVSSDFLNGCLDVGFVSAESTLIYEVELIDFSKETPFWKMETDEKLKACEIKKEEGNVLFKVGKFWRASRKYEKASKYVEYDHSFSADEKCQANALQISCHLNNAACKLKLGEYVEASRLCTKVLDLDESNVKALFRRSQAYLKTSELEKANDDIKRALVIDPDNRDVKLVYKELQDKKKRYVKYETSIFSTMLAKMT